MKRLRTGIILLFLVLSVNAWAGMTAQLRDGGPNNGGAFEIFDLKDVGTVDIWADYGIDKSQNFWTFCIEKNVTISRYTPYVATIDDIVLKSGKTLFDSTKKLYAAWLEGSEVVYTNGLGNEISLSFGHNNDGEGAVQAAIWESQGFSANYLDSDNYLEWAGLGFAEPANWRNVRALNFKTASGVDLQSQVVMTNAVPAPGALVLGSLGMATVGWLRRRKTL